jgi:hypothetical protein
MFLPTTASHELELLTDAASSRFAPDLSGVFRQRSLLRERRGSMASEARVGADFNRSRAGLIVAHSSVIQTAA